MALALAVAACTTPEEQAAAREAELAAAGWVRLDAAQVTSVIAANTHSGRSAKSDWIAYYEPAGTMRSRASGSWGSETDNGRWRVEADGLYCSNWTKWRGGGEGCSYLYGRPDASPEEGELTSLRVSGNHEDGNSWSYAAGNASGL